jgi:1-acyl-sn-glycerol-3-phosphate acyltransferase
MKIIRFTLRLLLFLLNLGAGLLIAALVFHGGNREYHHHKSIIRRWLKLCALITGCKVKMIRPADQSNDVRGSLFVANHVSWLDIFVFGGWFTLRFLSKSEVRDWPFFGWLSAASGTLFIERGRGAKDSITEIQKALVNMDNVMVFPESTTSSGVAVKPFHPRLLKAAIEAKRPVIPVMIRYHDNNQPLTDIALDEENHIGVTMWRVLSRPRTQVIIQQFSPIWPEQHFSRTELAKKCNSQISMGLATLNPQ